MYNRIYSFIVNLSGVNKTSEFVCQSDTWETNCSEGALLLVLSAVYGKANLDICVQNEKQKICPLGDVLSDVQRHCWMKQNCSLPVNHVFISKHCEGTANYLNVSYLCIPGKLLKYIYTTQRTHICL